MNIGIAIYPGAEVLDFSGPFEVFSTASRIGKAEDLFSVFLIATSHDVVSARGGYKVVPDFSIKDHPALDVLIVVGGVHEPQLSNTAFIEWIAAQSQRVSILASVCTGAFLLARAMPDLRCRMTTHWDDIASLSNDFPRLTVVEGVRWVDEGWLVTSGGISAGIDMSLHLVERLHSRKLAEATASIMEFDWTETSDARSESGY